MRSPWLAPFMQQHLEHVPWPVSVFGALSESRILAETGRNLIMVCLMRCPLLYDRTLQGLTNASPDDEEAALDQEILYNNQGRASAEAFVSADQVC